MTQSRRNLAYIIGVAMGDGNLSNPNGRAVRLRITCDLKYSQLIERIRQSIQALLPNNKVSIIRRAPTYCDISCYSNKWEDWLGWYSKKGSKFKQNISIPSWIKKNKIILLLVSVAYLKPTDQYMKIEDIQWLILSQLSQTYPKM